MTGAGLWAAVLVTTGRAGRHEGGLDFRLRAASAAEWERFLDDPRSAARRRRPETIIVVGGSGLLAALPMVYDKIPVQHCWAHKIRNILNRSEKPTYRSCYAEQAMGSRAPPRRVSPLVFLTPSIADPGAALAETAAAVDPAERLADFNPPQKGYRELRDELKRLEAPESAEGRGRVSRNSIAAARARVGLGRWTAPEVSSSSGRGS